MRQQTTTRQILKCVTVTFFIRFEHKFLRNIYSDEEIKQSPQICTLEKYYETYQNFVKISISLFSIFGSNINQDEGQSDLDLKDFLQEQYPEIDLEKLKSKIDDVEIKNIVKKNNGNKIPKFNLKLYAFVYDTIIDFPESNFMYDTIATANFFRNVHRLIKVKIHLHHSHITREILGYTHDFCNWTVHEYKSEIAMIAHNLFGFVLHSLEYKRFKYWWGKFNTHKLRKY